MTLVATLASAGFVTQVSDRRFVTPTGKIGTDKGNKAIVLACVDGLMCIAFAGLATYNHKRVDLMLAERLHDVAVAEMTIDDAVRAIADECSRVFAVVPRDVGHLVFTLAGYRTIDGHTEPRLLLVTNVHDTLGFAAPSLDEFRVQPFAVVEGKATLVLSGSGALAVSRTDRRRLEARARAASGESVSHRFLNRIEDGLLTLIRSAAERANGTVGKDCMAISLTPSGDARALSYPNKSQPTSYGPIFLWNAAGANFFAGDIETLSGAGYALAIGGHPGGFRLLVGSSDAQRGPPPKRLAVGMKVASSRAPTEEVTLVQLHSGISFR